MEQQIPSQAADAPELKLFELSEEGAGDSPFSDASIPTPPSDHEDEKVRRLLEKAGVISPKPSARLPEDDPLERIRQLLAGVYQTTEERFYEDGQRLAHETAPPCEPVALYAYYPTYQEMKPEQLQFYYYWRGLLRSGTSAPAPVAYGMLYLQELIHLIGADSLEYAIDQLRLLYQMPGDRREILQNKILLAVRDLYLMHRPTCSYIDPVLKMDRVKGSASLFVEAFMMPEDTRFDLFGALDGISNWKAEKSAFVKAGNEAFTRDAMRASFVALDEEYADCGGWLLHYLGHQTIYYPFGGLTFDRDCCSEPLPTQWVVSDCPRRTFQAVGHKLYTNVNAQRAGDWGKLTGQIARFVECELRRRCSFRMLKQPELPDRLAALLNKALDDFFAEREAREREANRRVFTVDLGLLQKERDETSLIRDKLVEVLGSTEQPGSIEQQSDITTDVPKKYDAAIHALDQLVKGPVTTAEMNAFAKASGKMTLVFVDELNQQLYDLVGDNCIEETDHGFALYTEYCNQVQEFLKQNGLDIP